MSTWWLLQKFHPAENTSAHPSAITDANCKASHSANVVLSLKLSDFDIAASPNVVRREDCSTASQNCSKLIRKYETSPSLRVGWDGYLKTP